MRYKTCAFTATGVTKGYPYLLRRSAARLISTVCLALMSCVLASASTITVTNLADSGPGSLRQAIAGATAGDTINFSVTGTITLTSGQLVIDKSLMIQGPGAGALSISGNGASRVFYVINGFHNPAATTTELDGITIRDGNAIHDPANYYSIYGGGVFNDGANLTIRNSAVSSNTAIYGGGISSDSGAVVIFNTTVSGNAGNGISSFLSSSLEVSNSTVSDNIGCGVYAFGPQIYNSRISGNACGIGAEGWTTITETTVSGYVQFNGINYGPGRMDITSSTIFGNIDIYGGEVSVRDSTISGGGIYNYVGAVFVSNSTISGSTDTAIVNDAGSLNLASSTISGNRLGIFSRDEVFCDEDGENCLTYPAVEILNNAIIAGNLVGGDIGGTNIETASHNLIGDAASSGGIQNGVNGNIVGVSPLLGPLQNNGGPTFTQALLPGSPAINAGDNCVIIENGCGFSHPALPTDQRGFARVGAVDIGAFEVQTASTPTPTPGVRSPFDFDGDGKTDISIYRPSNGEWWISRSSDSQVAAVQFGSSTDIITPGDFTGDGKADIAFFRPSEAYWYVLRSEDFTYFSFPFGLTGDIPVPADFDGDGLTDPAVFRPSTGDWWIPLSSGAPTGTIHWGLNGDKPVAFDYDGDGKADIGIVRDNLQTNNKEWWIYTSSQGIRILNFGAPGDITVPGDYTGDGKVDAAFFRPSEGNWYVLRSEDFSYFGFPWGLPGDVPVPGDYDGDGKTDAAVFRPSTTNWWINRTGGSGVLVGTWGLATDTPVPSSLNR